MMATAQPRIQYCQRAVSELLPEAGKPEGTCSDCGPHGNKGAVTLLYSVVPCLECHRRAEDCAQKAACILLELVLAGLHRCNFVDDFSWTEVREVPGQPWAREISVRVDYHKP